MKCVPIDLLNWFLSVTGPCSKNVHYPYTSLMLINLDVYYLFEKKNNVLFQKCYIKSFLKLKMKVADYK